MLGYMYKDYEEPVKIAKLQLKLNDTWERCKMYGNYSKPNVNGIYFTREEYFCVWTKDRNLSKVQHTIDRYGYL